MQDDVDELQYNPFASSIGTHPSYLLSSSPKSASFKSASNSASSSPNPVSEFFLNPTSGTFPTEASIEETTSSTSGQDHHPLRSAGLSTTFEDAGITRPHLTRVLDSGPVVEASSLDQNEQEQDQAHPSENEKVVIVHEVSSQDSLAGVALKYGISLTELRRANHLWTSDSIHLRKVLYIPVEKTSHSAPVFPKNEPASSSLQGHTPCEDAAHSADALSPPTVRRVPASELSFFPPPSKSSILSSSPSSSPALTPPSKSLHSRYATSPSPSLNSILTALPIAASTRDTIMARLSFDSASSSYSDRDRDPYLDDRENHELDDVKARREARALSEDNSPGYLNGHTLRNGQQSFTDRPPTKRPELFTVTPASRFHNERPGHGRSFSEEYTGPMSLPATGSSRIRNIQLEPSPVMQIPTRSEIFQLRMESDRLPRGKTRARLNDVTFASLESLETDGD
ncbi:carbohydrate-binding module family 50 protein [Collybiopsis luxurians FD-317 M1]|nr:carbohydrate-binding module family 50 protein [Collybiopsis luxurians FD-317 M1]